MNCFDFWFCFKARVEYRRFSLTLTISQIGERTQHPKNAQEGTSDFEFEVAIDSKVGHG